MKTFEQFVKATGPYDMKCLAYEVYRINENLNMQQEKRVAVTTQHTDGVAAGENLTILLPGVLEKGTISVYWEAAEG